MPLLWSSLAYLAGNIAAAAAGLPLQAWLAGACLGLAWLCGLRFTNKLPSPRIFALPVALLLFAFSAGAARYELARPRLETGSIGWYASSSESDPAFAGQRYVIEGVLAAPPDVRDRSVRLLVEVERFRSKENLLFTPVQGRVLALVPPQGSWQFGDRVRLEGILELPPAGEDFAYRDYLARQGIYAYMSWAKALPLGNERGNIRHTALFHLRSRALDLLYRMFPDPEASLLAGILLGIETGIPEGVQRAFQATGTTHIIAISGFNFAILSGLFVILFSRLLGRWKGAAAAIVAIVFYTLLVGAGPSVVRAAIMGSLALFARQLGRRQHGLNSLAFTAACMTLLDPQAPRDVGFQLSFAATLGLILYATPFVTAFRDYAGRFLPVPWVDRLSGPVGEYFLFTLAAQLTTLPIIVYHFQRLSLTSLLVNPLILPAQPAVMVVGGLAVLLGLIYLPLGQLVAYLALPFTTYTIRTVELFARLPGGNLALGETSLVWVVLFYALLLAFTFRPAPMLRLATQVRPALVLSILAALVVLVWRAALSAPDSRLHLTFFDVGDGDAVLIQTSGGRSVLLDGGPSARQLSDALGRRLPLGQRQLDWLVVGGAGDEQIGALPGSLERFRPASVLWAGPPAGSDRARQLRSLFAELRLPVETAVRGQSLNLGAGASLQVLAVCPRGAVYLLEWDSFRALLPVGVNSETLDALQADASMVQASVLLLAENGYAPANPPALIDKLSPQVIVLSVDAGSRRGMPSPETLDAVEGYNLLRTDLNGWIHVTTDGRQMWVEVER